MSWVHRPHEETKPRFWRVGVLALLMTGMALAQVAAIPVVPGETVTLGASDYACNLSISPTQPQGQKGRVTARRVDHPSILCHWNSVSNTSAGITAPAYRLEYDYRMDAATCGVDSVSFTETKEECQTDGDFYCGTGGASVTVTRAFTVDTPSIAFPEARADAATVAANSTRNPLNLTANDLNAAGATLGLPSAGSAQGGQLELDTASNGVRYTPPQGFSGRDSFVYTLTNCRGESRASVTLTVTAQAPTAQDAQLTVTTTGGNSLDLTPYVSNATRISIQSGPSFGAASVDGLRVIYTPGANFPGQDSFTYQAQGPGGVSASARVTLTSGAQAPVAQDAQLRIGPEGASTLDLAPYVRNATGISIQTAPSHGTASLNGLRVVYTPGPDFAGQDSFTYQAQGPGGVSLVARVGLSASILNSGVLTQGEVFRHQTHHITNSINRRIAQVMSPQARPSEPAMGAREGFVPDGDSARAAASPTRVGGLGMAQSSGDSSGDSSDDWARSDQERTGVRGGAADLSLLTGLMGADSPIAIGSGQARLDLPTQWLGLSAGDQPGAWGAWGNLNYTRLENSLSSSRYEGDLYSLIAGADYRLSDTILVGITLNYEDNRVDTDFNDGRADSDGFTLTPYLGYLLSKGEDSSLALSLMAGYGDLSHDTRRDQGSLPVSGDYDATRWLVELDLNWYRLVDRWNLHAFGGYLWAEQKSDAFTESDGVTWVERTYRLGEFKLGGQASYRLNDSFEPYARVAYYYNPNGEDLHVSYDPSQGDEQELELLLGFNWTPRPDTMGSLELSHGFLRDDQDRTSLMFHLRMDF